MIDVLNNANPDILEIKIVETVSKTDLDHLKPVLKAHIAETPVPKLLLMMEEFSGWDDLGAFFEDIQLESEFIREFDRIALAGDVKWEEWLTEMVDPLTSNEIEFFDLKNIEDARSWLEKNGT